MLAPHPSIHPLGNGKTVCPVFHERQNHCLCSLQFSMSMKLWFACYSKSSLLVDTGSVLDYAEDLTTFRELLPSPIPCHSRPGPHSLLAKACSSKRPLKYHFFLEPSQSLLSPTQVRLTCPGLPSPRTSLSTQPWFPVVLSHATKSVFFRPSNAKESKGRLLNVQIPSHLSSEIVILAEAWDSPFDQDDSYTDDTQIALSQNTSSLAQSFSHYSAL
jgi:hypothetical protein